MPTIEHSCPIMPGAAEHEAIKRQADPQLREDTVFLLECGPLALAWSER